MAYRKTVRKVVGEGWKEEGGLRKSGLRRWFEEAGGEGSGPCIDCSFQMNVISQ